MDNIVYVATNLINFLLAFLIILLLLYFFFKIYLKKNNLKKGNLGLYGIFLGLSQKDVFSIALLTVRYIFLIWCLFSKDIIFLYVLFLIIPGIIYNII